MEIFNSYFQYIDVYGMYLGGLGLTYVLYWAFTVSTQSANDFGVISGFKGSASIHEMITHDATTFGKVILYPIWAILYVFQWLVPIIYGIVFMPILLIVTILVFMIIGIHWLMFK